MYVCICKGITENQIRDAIRSGLCTRREISRNLKAGTACGKCRQEVRDLLQRSLSTGDSGLMSSLSDEGPQTFKIPSPGRLSLPESPVGAPQGALRPEAAQVVYVIENAACLA